MRPKNRIEPASWRSTELVFIVAFLLCAPAQASLAQPRGDGRLSLYNYHLRESLEVRYREGGQFLPEGLLKIESLFRSRDSDLTLPVDIRLIELLDRIEDHFQVRQIEVISGFRSPTFNRQLKEEGHDVARESLHMRGRAADIHLDEITEEALRDYAVSLKVGGVGFYPSLHMVHVDVGPARTWGEQKARKGWVGEKNDQIPVHLTISPDRTFSKRLGHLTVESSDPGDSTCLESILGLEFFDRGVWREIRKISKEDFSKEFPDLPYGKYRLKAWVCLKKNFQYSNEFYFKKR